MSSLTALDLTNKREDKEMKANYTAVRLTKMSREERNAMIDRMSDKDITSVIKSAYKMNPAAATMALATLTPAQRKAVLGK